MKSSTLPVLMIVTSHAQLGSTGKPTGIWAEELTTPYYALVDAGFPSSTLHATFGRSTSMKSTA
jgi:hypothetical protein